MLRLKMWSIGALAAMWFATAHAVPVVSVTGPDAFNPPSFLDAGAFAVSFDTGAAISNVDISAEYFCSTACSGSAFLLTDLGAAGQLLAFGSYDGTSQTVLSGVNLALGQNVLLLTVNSGVITWNHTDAPVIDSTGATPTGSFVSTLYDPTFPASSSFTALLSTALKYSVVQNVVMPPPPPPPPPPVAMPTPSSGLLFVCSLALWGTLRRKRMRHSV